MRSFSTGGIAAAMWCSTAEAVEVAGEGVSALGAIESVGMRAIAGSAFAILVSISSASCFNFESFKRFERFGQCFRAGQLLGSIQCETAAELQIDYCHMSGFDGRSWTCSFLLFRLYLETLFIFK